MPITDLPQNLPDTSSDAASDVASGAALGAAIQRFAPPLPLAVAFSGGADSTALLLACAERWPGQVVAIHVHHGLQSAADAFVLQCEKTCAQHAVPLKICRVDARHAPGQSPEDAARQLRYATLIKAATEPWPAQGGVPMPAVRSLALAQHADDQVETLLLALSRGAGVAGLAAMPAQEQARQVLLDVVLSAADGNVVGELGGRLRVKTWSWLGDQDPQSRQGGFAGWTADGSPIWAGGRGTSQMVLRHYGQALATVLPATWPAEAGRCVEVGLFSRYPVTRVLAGERPATSGPLQGDYRVEFANGNALDIHSDGELFLLNDKIVARLDREEYVARVLEREAKPEPAEAASPRTLTFTSPSCSRRRL